MAIFLHCEIWASFEEVMNSWSFDNHIIILKMLEFQFWNSHIIFACLMYVGATISYKAYHKEEDGASFQVWVVMSCVSSWKLMVSMWTMKINFKCINHPLV